VNWALRDAKNRLSELVRRAGREGPQTVTVRGKRAGVVISAADFDALVGGGPSLVDDPLNGPRWDDDLVEAVDRRADPSAIRREHPNKSGIQSVCIEALRESS